MVIALLACLTATVATGLVADGEQAKGPLAAVMVSDANAVDHEEGGQRTDNMIGELHGLLANITVALVVAHILGVALASLVPAPCPNVPRVRAQSRLF